MAERKQSNVRQLGHGRQRLRLPRAAKTKAAGVVAARRVGRRHLGGRVRRPLKPPRGQPLLEVGVLHGVAHVAHDRVHLLRGQVLDDHREDRLLRDGRGRGGRGREGTGGCAGGGGGKYNLRYKSNLESAGKTASFGRCE